MDVNRIRIPQLPRRLLLVLVVAAVAVVAGSGLAIAINDLRAQPMTGAADFTATGATPTPTASPSPTPSASPEPAIVAAPTQAPTPAAAPSSTPAPTAAPAQVPTPPPGPTATPGPTTPASPAPGSCDSFVFVPGPITVASLSELEAGIVGTWVGCLTTPWVEPYRVTITFREDGTYGGTAQEGSPDGNPAFYYGSDDDSPEKRYEINDLQDDLEGIGQIEIWFWEGNTNRGDLRNIRLMGDRLEFEFFHRGVYGPLTYRLSRVAD
jgi:hypothetical protein